MSTLTLRSQITEDHLTCPICFQTFTTPKALPCLHTFCESCLRDYTVGRGYEGERSFPCPTCRTETKMPDTGVTGFPDNHLMASLSHTIDRSVAQQSRPVPRPRRSIGQPQHQQDLIQNPQSQMANNNSADSNSSGRSTTGVDVTVSTGPDDFEMVNDFTNSAAQNSQNSQAPPSYFSVSDTAPSPSQSGGLNASSNSCDPSWMVIPQQEQAPPLPAKMKDRSPPPGYYESETNHQPGMSFPPYHPSPVSQSGRENTFGSSTDPPALGWNIPNSDTGCSASSDKGNRSFNTHEPRQQNKSLDVSDFDPLYPNVPPHGYDRLSTVCAENLMLRFGKLGPTPRDFIKPVGLAVNRDGHYVISDNGGETKRIFIYNSGGEIIAVFRSGGDVQDVTISHNGDIFAAICKSRCAIRHYSIDGKLKAEYGKFFMYEKPSGVGQLSSGAGVISGTEGHCVYILTDQMKLKTTFGRKGNGDGYFMQPSHITINSKDNIIVSDYQNCNIQIFSNDGKFKHRFGTNGNHPGQLNGPLGICVDRQDNIIVADSNNFRVEAFNSRGRWLSTVVKNTYLLGENVRPVNVAVTPTQKFAVLLQGPYFAEVRVYSSSHHEIVLQT